MIVLDRTEWISRRRVACGLRSFNVHGICGTSCYARFAYHLLWPVSTVSQATSGLDYSDHSTLDGNLAVLA